ncbi:MAG: hypothetical protein ACTTKH_00985 [Treponema sp.]
METKVYKPLLYRIILNVVLGFFAAVVGSAIITAIFFKKNNSILWFIVFAVIIYVTYLYLVVISNMINIEVTETELILKKKGKEERFPFSEYSFSAEIRSTRSTSTERTLWANKADGTRESIDCELIGGAQFESLMEDLGIIGDNSAVQKLETKHKE